MNRKVFWVVLAMAVVIAAATSGGLALIVSDRDDKVAELTAEVAQVKTENRRLDQQVSSLELELNLAQDELEAANDRADMALAKAERAENELSDLRYGLKEIATPAISDLSAVSLEERLNKVRLDLYLIFTEVFQGREVAWTKVKEALDEVKDIFPFLNREDRNALARATFATFSDSDVLSDAFTNFQVNQILDTLAIFALNEGIEM